MMVELKLKQKDDSYVSTWEPSSVKMNFTTKHNEVTKGQDYQLANIKGESADLAQAPISEVERLQLKADVANLQAAADRKGITLDVWDAHSEKLAGEQHFELGCWLYYYSKQDAQHDSLESRVDCARRIFMEGITAPGYRFFTAFNFGERQFDRIFEMGDSKQVIDGLREHLKTDTTGNLVKAFSYMGWPTEPENLIKPMPENQHLELGGAAVEYPEMVERAKEAGFSVRDANPARGIYSGPIINAGQHYVVQDAGMRTAVIHSREHVGTAIAVGEHVRATYSAGICAITRRDAPSLTR